MPHLLCTPGPLSLWTAVVCAFVHSSNLTIVNRRVLIWLLAKGA